MQFNFFAILFPVIIHYRLPNLGDATLRGLMRVWFTARANQWVHLAKLAHEQLCQLAEDIADEYKL
jgi:hypothetical protein